MLASLALVAVLWAGDAGAAVGSDDDPSAEANSPTVSRPALYTTLETALVLAGGAVWYLRHGATNEGWGRVLEWRTWKRKFDGADVDFDGDHYNTNSIGHPLGGAAYYQIARGNGFGAGSAFIVSAAASTFWEYFVEIPEHPSINDLIMTPVAGAAIGEATYQIGRALATSGSGTVRCAAAFVFAPVATLNDRLQCRRRAGILPALQIELATGWNRAVFDGQTVRDEFALSFGADLVSNRTYGRAGTDSVVVGPGQWSAFYGSLLLGENRLQGAWLDAHTVWAGRYDRSYRSPADETDLPGTGGPPQGMGWLLGLGSSFDYRLRDLPGGHDRIASAGLGGPMFELSVQRSVLFRLQLSVQYVFAIIGSMAYRAEPAQLYGQDIKTELRNNGYYYGHGVTSSSRITLDLGPIGLTGDARAAWYWSIDEGDPAQTAIQRDVLLRDTRVYTTATMWTRPVVGAFRFGLAYQHVWRTSYMLETQVSATEADITAHVAVGF